MIIVGDLIGSLRMPAASLAPCCCASDCDCVEWANRARRNIHWYSREHGAWLSRDTETGRWRGYDAGDASAIWLADEVDAHGAWQPWISVSDHADAPCVRWFVDALTNAAFNELDRHILQVHAQHATAASRHRAAALITVAGATRLASQGAGTDLSFVSDRAEAPPSSVSRRELLLQSVLAAGALRDELRLERTSVMAVYMPNQPQVFMQRTSCWFGI